MKQKLKTITLLPIFLAAQATGQNIRLSLPEAIREGVENNLEIRNAGIEKQKSQSRFTEQQSNLYPQVGAFSDFNYYYGIPKFSISGEIFGQEGKVPVEYGTKYDWISGFRATQVLYNQSYFTSLKIARRQTEIEQLNLQQKKEDLAYRIAQVYYLCLATRRQKEHLAVTMENMLQLLRITELQQQNGVIRKVDHDQVLVDQNNLKTEIDNLDLLYEQQINLLKYLTRIELNSTIELTGSLEPTTGLVQGNNPGWENRTEIKSLNAQIEQSLQSEKMSKQQYLPVLSGIAQYYYEGQQDEFNFFDGNERFFNVGYVGLSLTISVFDGFEKREKVRQQKLGLEQLKNTRNHTLDYFSKEFLDAGLQYTHNHAAVIRQEENIRIAEENYHVALLGYEQEANPLADLLRAQNSLTEARLSYDNALLQLKNAELDLIKSRGELLK